MHALKGDWEKANDFLRHSVMGVERCCPISDQFFHEYVLSLFAEPLGYLLTHVIDDAREANSYCLKSRHCQNNHAFYPFLPHGLGVLEVQGGRPHQEATVEALIKCARLVRCWPEALCVCFNAYYRTGTAALELKKTDRVREVLLESIGLARPARMTHLQISLWKRLAQVDFEENKFLQALSSYAKALRSALSICTEEEQVDIQCLYQHTMACVVLAISQAGYSKELAGPAINDTEPVDGLAYALSVLAQFENNRSMESDLLQELADCVAVELQVKQAAWIDKCLTDLMVIHQDSGAYGKAAEVSHTLKIWESQRAIGKAIRCSSLVV